jgi:hypothetical protein
MASNVSLVDSISSRHRFSRPVSTRPPGIPARLFHPYLYLRFNNDGDGGGRIGDAAECFPTLLPPGLLGTLLGEDTEALELFGAPTTPLPDDAAGPEEDAKFGDKTPIFCLPAVPKDKPGNLTPLLSCIGTA